jgi:poly-gamma-glutamate capsule biosynthesis protein CapA/YwtB (metallophosphatase superfamily)
MKFRLQLLIVIILASLCLPACADVAAIFVDNDLKSSGVPSETSAFSIQVWGQPLLSDTLTLEPTSTPIPPEATRRPPTRTPLKTATQKVMNGSPTLFASPTVTLSPTSFPTIVQTPGDIDSVTTLIFTGALVPARCVQAAIDERGDPDFIFADIQELISDAHLTVGLLQSPLSDYPPHTGWCEDSSFVLVSRAENADAMARAGFDVMSVSSNHIKNCGLPNCGDITFLDTLQNLREAGIIPVGGGMNLDEARQPVVVTVNGIRFSFIALSAYYVPEPFATDTQPGIASLTEDHLREAVNAAKEISDVVIFLPHWGADYPTTLNEDQRDFSKIAVEAGVDLIIGNHPHYLQGMQSIQGIPVFYSLGSFVFDQTQEIERQQGLVVRVTFQGTKIAWYDVIPIHIDGNGHVQVASQDEAADILIRFQELSTDLE